MGIHPQKKISTIVCFAAINIASTYLLWVFRFFAQGIQNSEINSNSTPVAKSSKTILSVEGPGTLISGTATNVAKRWNSET